MIRRFILYLMLLGSTSSLATELSPYAANKALQANQFAQEERFGEAIRLLEETQFTRAYDKAYLARMLGVFYWQNEQLKPAIKSLNNAVNSGELQDEQGWTTRRMLADLLLMDQQYQQALSHYYQLTKQVPADQKAHELWLRIAQVHYQLQQWKKTLEAMAHYERFKRPDEITPLSVKLGAQLQLERWSPAIDTLKRLITLEPTKSSWWLQLVSLELRTGQQKEALNSLGLAKLQGVELSQQELRLLAQLYAQNGIPERAAQLLEQLATTNSDLDLITERATYWQRAKEWDKAIETWLIAAKRESQYYWNVALLQSQQGEYQQALASLEQVKGQQRQPEMALARARVLYKLNKLDDALAQAKKAHHLEPSQESKGWVNFLSQLRAINARQTS
ncbi:tetratricopeptide repeat protein [Vibrio cincinnatiensis]|uniref:tetratricopeptide repeat protein n=1 Tax=Vibrio cincinnatiensis TaxID=675 RepID=UPI0012ACDDD5|nr:tetratricopeptide repeat protein [Vibrio cincinnatiensis]MCG3732050.1 tetratricopeptide repeat protein [Vibrio cincinnatiensis]MCG3739761.1 tetratricopeptide repeat protein [Vibrio cincinnatiensis]MCG3747370.1 tetratricopeptide repeat protein [Vibrio cincinnatiensis]MCG3760189.1 tetratricopeptide repeat protein [Vibrio cincinnatiensis]MCG3763497.1 tetratricopeptide repeat protein [Vibrio cincinnatiensis]